MKYYLFCQKHLSNSSISELLVFNSVAAREEAKKSMERRFDYFSSFDDSAFSLNEVYMRLLENDPINTPESIYERAKVAFDLMKSVPASMPYSGISVQIK